VGCLLSLVNIYFAVPKPFSLLQSRLFILSLDAEHFEFYLGSCSLYLNVPVYFLLPKVVLKFCTLRSLIYFELIFGIGWKAGTYFQSSTCRYPVFLATFEEAVFFSIVCFRFLCWRSIGCSYLSLCLGLLILWSSCLFCANIH
jgi:hypothetical protein